MRSWLTWVTNRPRTTLALVAAVTLGLLASLSRLHIETDGYAFVPTSHRVVRRDRILRQLFDLRDPLVVVLDGAAPGSALRCSFLRRLTRLTESIRTGPDVDPGSVTSLATLRRVAPEGRESVIVPALASRSDPGDGCEERRGFAGGTTPYAGILVARDHSAAAVLAALNPDVDRGRAYERLRRVIGDTGAVPFHIAGAVAAESQLGVYVIRDLATMLPLVSLVVGAVLYLTYRTWWAVILPVAEIGIVIVWTFGLMALLGSPVYIVTAILPVILMAIGVADEIHIFGHYYERAALEPGKDRRTLVVEAVDGVRLPVIFSAVTTALGFLSFGGASLPALQSFGLYTAFGVIAAMVLTLSYIPAALVLLPVDALRFRPRDRARQGGPIARALATLGGWVHDRPRTVLALCLVTAVGCLPGVHRVYVDDSWFGNFGRNSEVRRAGDFLDEKFAGSHELDVVVESGRPNGALDPDFLRRARGFARWTADRTGVGAVLSAPDLLGFLHGELSGSDHDWLPATLPEAAQLTELARLGGALDIDHLLDDDRRATVLRVFLRRASYVSVDRLLGELRRAAAERFSGTGEEVSFVGDVMVSQTTVGIIVSDQVRTLLTALVMVLIAASVMFRSLVGGLFAVMPLALAVLLNFAFMGYAGIPLGIATSMFASLAIGIGVDYAIHFLARHARSLQAADSRAALCTTLATTGRAIFYNAAVVALGFLVLTASAMPPNRMLGLLVAISMMTSFLAGITLLPAALVVIRPSFISRVRT